MISFKCTLEEARLINRITQRAVAMASSIGVEIDPMTMNMDLTACHANGCPLKLKELLAADEFNFSHDIFGIIRHISRTDGQLRDCFVPRYAQPEVS